MRILVFILAAIILTSCGAQSVAPAATLGPISIADPWVRGTTVSAAGYMTLTNAGSMPDRLLAIVSDSASTSELHTTTEANGIVQMRPAVDGIEIPAGGRAELQPGGAHVMLLDLKYALKAGDYISLTLRFEHAGEITLEAPVRLR